MAKICVGFSNFVILGGAASFGLLVWDHAKNEGRVLSKVKRFCNEVKQNSFKGSNQPKVVANKKSSKAGRSNDDQKKTTGVIGYLEAYAKSVIQKLKLLKTVFVLLFRALKLIFEAVMRLKINDEVGKGDETNLDPKDTQQ